MRILLPPLHIAKNDVKSIHISMVGTTCRVVRVSMITIVLTTKHLKVRYKMLVSVATLLCISAL